MDELFDKFIELKGSIIIEEKDQPYIEERFWKYVEENNGFSKCPECGKTPIVRKYGECKIKRETDIKERNVKLWYKGLFPNKEFPCVETFYGENAKDIDFPIYISHIECCIYIYPWNLRKIFTDTSEIYYYEEEYVIYFNTIFDHMEKLIPYDYYLSRKADEDGPNLVYKKFREDFNKLFDLSKLKEMKTIYNRKSKDVKPEKKERTRYGY